jgi:branched-chain amino acid transport system ATP-binding protein
MLTISDLTVAYSELTALHDMTLNIERGKLTAVVGANGSGKSTLLKTIMGWVRPAKGRIELEGVRLENEPVHKRVRMGVIYVPEGRRLFPDLTLLENLELGAYTLDSTDSRKQRLSAVLEKFPVLQQRKNQPARTLSGGEQQLVAIARALMAKPTLLMLDEPSFGLSPKASAQIFDIMSELPKEGVTCLLVEQDVAKALRAADAAFVLRHGKVVAHGRGTDLLRQEVANHAYLGSEA